MAIYRLLPNGVLKDEGLETEASIPNDPNNLDWLEYQTWLSENNTPLPLILVNTIPHRKITRFAFIRRFTTTEQVTLELASIDTPSADMQQRQLQATLRVFMRNINTAAYIDLDAEDVNQGVGMLAAYGLITSARAQEILTNPVQPYELYLGTD